MGEAVAFRNQFALRCPACHQTGRIDVAATVWVRLTKDGTDAEASDNGDQEWEANSGAQCAACGFGGNVSDFHTFQCQNCLAVHNERELRDDPVPDLHERVAEGEPIPDGECPACGALCHRLEDSGEMDDGEDGDAESDEDGDADSDSDDDSEDADSEDCFRCGRPILPEDERAEHGEPAHKGCVYVEPEGK